MEASSEESTWLWCTGDWRMGRVGRLPEFTGAVDVRAVLPAGTQAQ